MEILVKRNKQYNNCTVGQLLINNEPFCHTLEDPVRDLKIDGSGKMPGRTAIPEGKYLVILSYSNRFNKVMPLLLNVPFFQGIRIHSGNTCDDTEGCILVGKDDQNGYLIQSRITFSALMEVLNKANETEAIYITIQNCF
jgi:hypothetical protein